VNNVKKKLKSLICKIKGRINLFILMVKKDERYYFLKGKKLLRDDSNKAKDMFKKGLTIHPNNPEINKEMAYLEQKDKNWNAAISYLDKYINKEQKIIPPQIYFDLADWCKKIGLLNKMDEVLFNGLQCHPNNRRMFSKYVNVAISKKDWQTSIKRLESYNYKYKDSSPYKARIKLSMLYKIIGDHGKFTNQFNLTLNEFGEKVTNDKLGYSKIIIYDNGESRIEYYKKFTKTNQLVITFDSINMVWSTQPFAFKLLSRKNVDIIAIRKRKKQTYQQDLSQSDFIAAVKPITKGYDDIVSYGFSLGAYLTLYFGSLLNSRILSISPRLSIHPIYGRKKVIQKYEFKHNLSFPKNKVVSPIIVYDPKNKLDNRYVNEHILKSFPNSILVEVPYGGHGMAPHLLKIGQLKEFVNEVIDNKGVPKYNSSNRSKSNIYYRLLASTCFKRNKPIWAYNLVEKSLDLLPTDKLAIKLKIDILKHLGEYEKAISFAKEAVKLVPKNLDVRIYLIDLSNGIGKTELAKSEISKAIAEFGNKKSLVRRLKNTKKNSGVKDEKLKPV